MTLLAIILLLGLAVLVSGFPSSIGHGQGILRDGSAGQSWDGSRNSGNWGIGQSGRHWDITNNGDNFVFDRLVGNVNGGGISGENRAYNYDVSGHFGNNIAGKVSGDIFRRYLRNGIELGGYIAFE